MKMTDGMFAKVFDEIGAKYPDIQVRKMNSKLIYRKRNGLLILEQPDWLILQRYSMLL